MRSIVARFRQSFSVRFWLLCLVTTATVGLAVMSPASAQSFVSGYSAKTSLQPGIIVAISEQSDSTVEAVPGGQSTKIHGVVIDPADATVTVANTGQDVFVATSGQYQVLVSIENGTIEAGDYLSISSTDGIAAEATSAHQQIIGRALSGFDGKSNVLTKTASGDAVGSVLTDIIPGKNPLRGDGGVPGPLQNAAESIAGKEVSAVRLYGALVILLAAIFISASIIWVGVRGGMVAIGRNPLSRGLVMKSLTQVIAVSVLIFVVGVIGVYLLLKL